MSKECLNHNFGIPRDSMVIAKVRNELKRAKTI